MPLFHLTLASTRRQVLFPSISSRTAALRALARVAGHRVLLFALVDDHVHVVLEDEHPGGRGRALRLALRPLSTAPLDPARPRPVEGRDHLERLVPYLLGQGRHHGLSSEAPVESVLSIGSCALDLLGCRLIQGLSFCLATWLPRFKNTSILRLFDLDQRSVEPIALDQAGSLGARRLIEAASLVTCADPGLGDRSESAVRARSCVVHLAERAGLPRLSIGQALGLSRQAQAWLLQRPPSEPDIEALLRRLALEEAVSRRRVS